MNKAALPQPADSTTIDRRMIRDAVLKALKRKKWSLRQLSQASGVSYSRIYDWLGDKGIGTRGPKVDNVDKILAVLGLRVCGGEPKKGGKK
jgi:transcriptional regulator with XRE-family HTH domain